MRFIVSTTALSCKLAALSKVVNSGINLNAIYKAFESANVDADSSVFQVILERIGRIPVSRQKYQVDRIIKREIIKEKKKEQFINRIYTRIRNISATQSLWRRKHP